MAGSTRRASVAPACHPRIPTGRRAPVGRTIAPPASKESRRCSHRLRRGRQAPPRRRESTAWTPRCDPAAPLQRWPAGTRQYGGLVRLRTEAVPPHRSRLRTAVSLFNECPAVVIERIAVHGMHVIGGLIA